MTLAPIKEIAAIEQEIHLTLAEIKEFAMKYPLTGSSKNFSDGENPRTII